MHQLHSDNRPPPMTFDEVSMERSKSFLNALSELKNLRPQLYSAAEYCENSYLHSEQKQMVLDNLKDYAVRALVNAVDHLGTVAYKLTDVFEQQTSDLSSMELKVSCLNQQLLTCKTYMDIEGLRQQELLTSVPRHHKHYVLPNSVTKKVHFSPQTKTDGRQILFQARPRLRPAGIPASTTLSWHLASESKPTLSGTQHAFIGTEESKASGATFGALRLLGVTLDAEGNLPSKSSSDHLQSPSGGPAANVAPQSFSVTMKESLGASKPLKGFRSLEHPCRGKIIRAPVRSRSMFSAFLAKQKAIKPSCIS